MISHPLSRLLILVLLTLFGMSLINRMAPPAMTPTKTPMGFSAAPFANSLATSGLNLQPEPVWPEPTIATQPNLKVAFIADTDDGESFRQVIQLIRQEGAELVLHQGDFSYATGPTANWLAAIDLLDSTIPYLGVDGNHDRWEQYVPFFEAQLQKTGVHLTNGSVLEGTYAATYKGLLMVMNQQGGDTDFSQQVLAQSPHIWKVCSWHHNRRDFQPGGKGDGVALETYQACINGGAIIATGHEHSYSRSYSLSDLSTPHYGAGGKAELMQISVGSPGSSFFFVSGLGGRSLRDYHALAHDDDGWWATIYTQNRYCAQSCTAADFSQQDKSRDVPSYNYTFGALFIDFNVGNDPYRAHGYFKTVDGDIVDEFTIIVNPKRQSPAVQTEPE